MSLRCQACSMAVAALEGLASGHALRAVTKPSSLQGLLIARFPVSMQEQVETVSARKFEGWRPRDEGYLQDCGSWAAFMHAVISSLQTLSVFAC